MSGRILCILVVEYSPLPWSNECPLLLVSNFTLSMWLLFLSSSLIPYEFMLLRMSLVVAGRSNEVLSASSRSVLTRPAPFVVPGFVSTAMFLLRVR